MFSQQDIRLPKSKMTALILSPCSVQHSIGPRVRAPLDIVTSPISPGKTLVPEEMAAGTLPTGISFSLPFVRATIAPSHVLRHFQQQGSLGTSLLLQLPECLFPHTLFLEMPSSGSTFFPNTLQRFQDNHSIPLGTPSVVLHGETEESPEAPLPAERRPRCL